MAPRLFVLAFLAAVSSVDAFGVLSYHRRYATRHVDRSQGLHAEDVTSSSSSTEETSVLETAEVQKVGNLVADDEWEGFSMELTELVRVAIIEDVKKNAKEFLGKDEYKVGDVSKELDVRVKSEVARFRNKDEYELGDLTLALDELSKKMTCELTGKEEYETGDLSIALDKRIKEKVAEFCGKDAYEIGDLSREIDARVKNRVAEFTGKGEYTFGDISNAIEERRRQWVGDFLGKEAADEYQFGDITKKVVSGITGKDDYKFGDVTKTVIGNMFGPRKGKQKKD